MVLVLSAVTACQRAERHQPTASEARRASQELVEQNLLSPGHVRFSTPGEMSVDELSPGRFRVRGFVDYQGRAGMGGRTNYTCVVHYGDNGRWEMEDLKWE